MHRFHRLVAIAAILATLLFGAVAMPVGTAAQNDICPTPTDPGPLDADDDGDSLDTPGEDTLDFTAPDVADDGLDDLVDDLADLTAPDVDDDGTDDTDTADLTAPDVDDDGTDDTDTADLTAPDVDDDGTDTADLTAPDLSDDADDTADFTAPDDTDDVPPADDDTDTADLTAPGDRVAPRGSGTGTLSFAAMQIEECNPCDLTLTPVATATTEPTSTPTEVPPTATATDPIPQFADFDQSGVSFQIVDCDTTGGGDPGDGDGDSDDADDTAGDGGSVDTVTDLPKTGTGDAGDSASAILAGLVLASLLTIAAMYDRARRRA